MKREDILHQVRTYLEEQIWESIQNGDHDVFVEYNTARYYVYVDIDERDDIEVGVLSKDTSTDRLLTNIQAWMEDKLWGIWNSVALQHWWEVETA